MIKATRKPKLATDSEREKASVKSIEELAANAAEASSRRSRYCAGLGLNVCMAATIGDRERVIAEASGMLPKSHGYSPGWSNLEWAEYARRNQLRAIGEETSEYYRYLFARQNEANAEINAMLRADVDEAVAKAYGMTEEVRISSPVVESNPLSDSEIGVSFLSSKDNHFPGMVPVAV